jgi:hypothetical protein
VRGEGRRKGRMERGRKERREAFGEIEGIGDSPEWNEIGLGPEHFERQK